MKKEWQKFFIFDENYKSTYPGSSVNTKHKEAFRKTHRTEHNLSYKT